MDESSDQVAAPVDVPIAEDAPAVVASDATSSTPALPPFAEGTRALAAKVLTPELFATLHALSTSNGFTAADCVKSAVENPDAPIGVYAGDDQCYELFQSLFDPLIAHLHPEANLSADAVAPAPALDPALLAFEPLDPAGAHIISTRISIARNIAVST
jgi:arginine kinase